MSERKRFEITTEALSLDDVAARVNDPRYGAITTFAGMVRGETMTAELKAGQSYSRLAGVEHNVVNAGTAPLSFVETELKALPG